MSVASAVTVDKEVHAPVEAVWAVLSDGWAYATWVVGASRVRAVDDGWPSVGTRLHHSFGVWPTLIDDETEVLDAVEPTRLVLKARGWPLGEAHVQLDLHARSSRACIVEITEDVVSGPVRLAPMPLRQALITPRNRETLARLAYLAEGRYHEARRD
jgi:uncharacterized protein YndB with AHSA1/START domain